MDGVARPDLFCEDGFHPAPALYARVAERLTDHIVELVQATTAPKLTTEKP
jgi:lysophospholipase L1-like esterase